MTEENRYSVCVGHYMEVTETKTFKDGTKYFTILATLEDWLEQNIPDHNWTWSISVHNPHCASGLITPQQSGKVYVHVYNKSAAMKLKLAFGKD